MIERPAPMTIAAARRPPRQRPSVPTSPARLVFAGSALAWAALAVMVVGQVGMGDHRTAGRPQGDSTHHHVPGIPIPTPGWVGMWSLMVVAMMWPLALPCLDAVARGAYRRWRPGLIVTALATGTALWLVFGLVATMLGRTLSAPVGVLWWQLGWIAVAVAALGSARRSRLLWRCAKLPPVAPGGLRGVVSAARAATISWQRCALLCGPAMTAMAVGAAPALMVCAALSAWWEVQHPRAWRDPVPAVLLAVAAGSLLTAFGAVGG